LYCQQQRSSINIKTTIWFLPDDFRQWRARLQEADSFISKVVSLKTEQDKIDLLRLKMRMNSYINRLSRCNENDLNSVQKLAYRGEVCPRSIHMRLKVLIF